VEFEFLSTEVFPGRNASTFPHQIAPANRQFAYDLTGKGRTVLKLLLGSVLQLPIYQNIADKRRPVAIVERDLHLD